MSEINNKSIEFKKIRKEKVLELESKINIMELNFSTLLKKYEINFVNLLKKQNQIKERVQCPFNKNHFVTKKNYEKHYRRCKLISEGINTKLSLPRPPSSQFFYTNTNIISLLRQNIDINDKEKIEIFKSFEKNNNLPPYEIKKYKNDRHIICNIKDGNKTSNVLRNKTIEEKLKECINDIFLSSKIENEFIDKNKNIQNIDKIMELVEEKKEKVEKNEKSKIQLFAEQRDYKRRRKSYRAKNIRITKRSSTQIQKDIIDSFMKDYKLYLEIEKSLQKKKINKEF